MFTISYYKDKKHYIKNIGNIFDVQLSPGLLTLQVTRDLTISLMVLPDGLGGHMTYLDQASDAFIRERDDANFPAFAVFKPRHHHSVYTNLTLKVNKSIFKPRPRRKVNSEYYFGNLMRSIDQTANAICAGDADTTISARIGYMANVGNPSHSKWAIAENIVNWAFEPLDGTNHCARAYLSDSDERINKGPEWSLTLMLGIVVISCALIGPLLRASSFIWGKP